MIRFSIILTFLILTNFVNGQWPADSFAVVHSVDFEDNTIGIYGYHPAEWEADWGETFNWWKGWNITSIIQKGDTKCMEIVYPEGTYNGVDQGLDFTVDIPGTDADSVELYLSYDLMWKPNFDFVISGKPPGHMVVGDHWAGEHGGGPEFDEGGRFGVSWWNQSWLGQGHSVLAWYFYHHDYEEGSGEGQAWSNPYDPYGLMIFYTGEEIWYNITIRMVVNTCNDWENDEIGNNDGYAEGFINGRWVTRWDNVRMRNVDTIGIDQLIVYSQFGGNEPMFAATRDEWALADNYYLWTYASGVTSVPKLYERSDSSRVLHIPEDWTNATLDYGSDTIPSITGIPTQTINAGETFTPITLDNYVYDSDNDDDELTWAIYDASNIEAEITTRVATLTYTDWTGTEYIKFVVTDPNGNADSTTVAFTVNDTTSEGTILRQRCLINFCDQATEYPPSSINGRYWNHFGYYDNDPEVINTIYNTEGENSGFKLTGATSGTLFTNNYGYKGTAYPDTCEESYWMASSTDDPVTMDLYGFTVGEEYKLKIYSSIISDLGSTKLTFIDTAKYIVVNQNDSILEWVWAATDTIEEITLEAYFDYGIFNVMEIEEYTNPTPYSVRYIMNVDGVRWGISIGGVRHSMKISGSKYFTIYWLILVFPFLFLNYKKR